MLNFTTTAENNNKIKKSMFISILFIFKIRFDFSRFRIVCAFENVCVLLSPLETSVKSNFHCNQFMTHSFFTFFLIAIQIESESSTKAIQIESESPTKTTRVTSF